MRYYFIKLLYTVIFILFVTNNILIHAQNKQNKIPVISLEKFYDGIHHWCLDNDTSAYPRYKPADVLQIADNLLAYQNSDGGWPKNIDLLGILNPDSVINSLSPRYQQSTYDNRNIYPQIEYLSKVYFYSNIEKYRIAAEAGINYILSNQYENGGWRGWDADAITYNDDVMTGIMNLLLDITEEKEYYNWIETTKMEQIRIALNKAINVTLKSQIIFNGEKTAWCQQHDYSTYKPVMGRPYEKASVTAKESVSVVTFLMRIENPDDSIVSAIKHAINWFNEVKLQGLRLDTLENNNVQLIKDPESSLWARYYDLEKNEPILCTKDGKIVNDYNEISPERRYGYEWYGTWPDELLKEDYPQWLSKLKCN